MFNLKIYLVGLFFWLSLGAFAQSDEAIIKEIIKADHESFWNKDFETWTTFYAHTPDVYFFHEQQLSMDRLERSLQRV